MNKLVYSTGGMILGLSLMLASPAGCISTEIENRNSRDNYLKNLSKPTIIREYEVSQCEVYKLEEIKEKVHTMLEEITARYSPKKEIIEPIERIIADTDSGIKLASARKDDIKRILEKDESAQKYKQETERIEEEFSTRHRTDVNWAAYGVIAGLLLGACSVKSTADKYNERFVSHFTKKSL